MSLTDVDNKKAFYEALISNRRKRKDRNENTEVKWKWINFQFIKKYPIYLNQIKCLYIDSFIYLN